MADIVNLNSPGEDALKGGVFFGSSLVPTGSFSNTPNFYTFNPTEDTKVKIELTLKKITDSLKQQLKDEYNYTSEELEADNATVERYLYDLTTLLIDYRDLRNFVFFGSAHTEVAYDIKHIIETYPYKTLIADLTTSFDEIIMVNDNANNQTSIIFSENAIRDIGNFKFFDSNNSFVWSNYDLVDKNNKRYEIISAIAPYSSVSIPFISNIQNGGTSIKITTAGNHGFLNGQSIEIFEVNGTLFSNETRINANGKFDVINVTPNSFEIIDMFTKEPLTMNFSYTSGGKARMLPLDINQRPYGFKIIVNGIITFDELLTYTDEIDQNGYSGFIISPKQGILNDFELNLSPVESQLLAPAPLNVTPWPRRQITNNIENRINEENPNDNDINFVNWLSNPSLMYVKDGGPYDDDIAYSDVYSEYNILRAQALDESATNQLIRRCIPYDAISELNDADDGYFQRFILIAGWFFDQFYLYIKFIKYVHTLNYGEFNQLSPEYYKYYADHYGFELFSDDSIDFSKLVVKTEPGLFFNVDSTDTNSKYFRNTIEKLQYERQKRLLLSLFYLYRIKGTQACIKTLVSLLGAPEGLLLLQEFAYKFTNVDNLDYYSDVTKTLIVDNEKVHVPEYHFEIDPDYLVDKTNINNNSNEPYVYRMRLHNESTINLRQLGISTDPTQAIDNQIKTVFGNTKYDFVKFNNGEFANLQNENKNHFLLPLTIPDKFFGLSVNYMINRDGFVKGVGNNLEEAAVHIGSLILLGATTFKQSSVINNIVLSNGNTVATITTSGNHSFLLNERINISGVNGITNLEGSYVVTGVPSNNSIQIIGVFGGNYTSGGVIEHAIPNKINNGFNTTYCLPEVFSNYDEDTILNPNGRNSITDFNLLFKHYPDSNFMPFDNFQYIFTRLEGNDLVIRLKLSSEYKPIVVERVAIFKDIFENDGLYHSLRMIYRAEGVEIYKDYEYVGLATWKLPTTSDSGIPYLAFEIPKKDILTCTDQIIPIDDLTALRTNKGNDKPKWWDLFIGLPQNVEFFFNKVEYFENAGIDDFNIGDKIVDNNNSNADSYVFDFKQYELNGNSVSISCQYLKANPVNKAIDYSSVLPTYVNQNNVVVIDGLTLTTKSFSPDGNLKKIYPQIKQDFFADSNVFERYGWQSDIHKVYKYKNFGGKVFKLNNLYSPQVLTYEALLEFLNLIENKFKKTIQQFIPIVINISEFGRLIKPSEFNQPKVRYVGIHKYCKGEKITSNSSIQSKIFDEPSQPVVIEWQGIEPYCLQASSTTTSTTTSTTSTSTTSTTTTSTSTTSTTTSTTTTTTTIPIVKVALRMVLEPSPSGLKRMRLYADSINGPFTSVFSFRFGQCTDGSNGTFCNGYPSAPYNQNSYGIINGQIGATTTNAYAGANAGLDGYIVSVTVHGLNNITPSQITKAAGETWQLYFE